jgi:hypothetical protein
MRPRAKKPAAKASAPPVRRKRAKTPVRRGLDFYHLLAVVSGAFAGLALYAWVTPGQIPAKEPIVRADPRADLMLTQVKGRREADGLMHVRGLIRNGRAQTCRLASVTVRFFDRAGKQVADTMTTAEAIAGGTTSPFEAHAHAPEAVRFEVAVDLAQFDVGHGRP